ncbi:hypothetical protein MRX96_057959 [Rhipicephalus microplus]
MDIKHGRLPRPPQKQHARVARQCANAWSRRERNWLLEALRSPGSKAENLWVLRCSLVTGFTTARKCNPTGSR